MDYFFVPMTAEFAGIIVNTWKYEGDYAIYDYVNEREHMLDTSAWGRGIFAVLDGNTELIGELSVEFFDSLDETLEYHYFSDEALLNQREMWIGFGLKPALTGKGFGAGFVTACVDFSLRSFPYYRDYIYLGVAKFNQRAIRAYEKAGFQIFDQTTGEIAGKQFDCVSMRKRIQGSTLISY